MLFLEIKSARQGLGLLHVPLMDARGMHYTMHTEWNVPDDNNMTNGTNGVNKNSYLAGYLKLVKT